jgi:glycosyltransferase domain-containing protein
LDDGAADGSAGSRPAYDFQRERLPALEERELAILIPSRAREHQVRALLDYFEAAGLRHPVFVLESGDRYRGFGAHRAGLSLEILHYPDDMPVPDRMADALSRIAASYVCICTDDDLTLAPAIESCAAFLKANPEYAACQGYHARFEVAADVVYLDDILWFTPSLEDESALQRLSDLMERYQPICWAVYRKDVLSSAIRSAGAARTYLFTELSLSATAVAMGKVKRLPIVYCARHAGALQLLGHPLYLFLNSPAIFIEDYVRYRDRLVAVLPTPADRLTEVARQIDLIHSSLFLREVDGGVINHFRNAVLKNSALAITDDEMARLLAPPPLSRAENHGLRIDRAGRIYELSARFCDPEPKHEISLPPDYPAEVLDALDHYPVETLPRSG